MMRRISLSLLAATAMGLIACHGASAADMRMPVKAPAPLPPPVQDWSGVYVGVEGGYGWGGQSNSFSDPFGLNPNSAEFHAAEDKEDCCNKPSFFEFNEFLDTLNIARPFGTVNLGNTNTSGWLFGAFFGAQKQWGSWVLGLEADVDGADIKGTSSAITSQHLDFTSSASLCDAITTGSCDRAVDLRHAASLETKIDEIADLRGKIGYAWSPNWMIYGTGGMAFAHVKNTLTNDESLHFGDDCGSGPVTSISDSCDQTAKFARSFVADSSQTQLGWTVGAGIDYKWQLDPGSALVFGIQYLYYNFPTQTFTFTGPGGASVAFDTSQTINVVKGRISYLFSIH